MMFPTLPYGMPWIGWVNASPAVDPAPASQLFTSKSPSGVIRTRYEAEANGCPAPHKMRSLGSAYRWLVDTTQDRLRHLGAVPRAIPDRWSERKSSNGKFALSAQAWQLAGKGNHRADMRIVTIQGGMTNIVNAWIFPDDPTSLPVFAAELIGVAEVTRVGFIDIQTPAMGSQQSKLVADEVQCVADCFKGMPCDEAAPDWATCESTGNFTYVRGATSDHLTSVCACYLAYLDCYLSLTEHLDGNSHQPKDASAVDALHAYQLHHMQHSPGKKFLSNLFEADWTEEFMLEFLFARPSA